MSTDYLHNVKQQFKYYKMLGDKTFEQVTDAELFWSYNNETNSIAIIVKHLAGNMLSRWTDFLTSDGEKDWRKREEEFENSFSSRQELLDCWNKGWNCLFHTLNILTPNDLNSIVFIRNQGHTVMEAINRQLAHYPYHVGQIVFIGKMVCSNWQSLSIPKGNSEEYNKEKFSRQKHKEHFTEELLRKKEDT